VSSTQFRQNVVSRARRLVVKIGTGALTDKQGRLDVAFLGELAAQVAEMVRNGLGVTIVSSGAVGAGMAELDLTARPKTLPMLQATAAVGQGQLMRHFYDAFNSFGITVAQILVTRADFETRSQYLNIRNTIAALQELRAVPILNENDSVAVDELRFGDNDIIAAHVTNMLRADLLVLLSNVDGVLVGGKVVDVIDDPEAFAARLPESGPSRLGSGGIAAKLAAAHLVTSAGEVAIIANARVGRILPRLLGGEKLGTLCIPSPGKMTARRRWIGHASRIAGRIIVDDGAAKALLDKGSSLLPSGVVGVEGNFQKGDTIAVVDRADRQLARGLTNYSAQQTNAIKGLKTGQIAKAIGEKPYDEVVHRNNMTLL